MPYAPHYRVTWSGTLGVPDPVEIFAFGLSLDVGPSDFLNRDDLFPLAGACLDAWAATMKNHTHQMAGVDRVRVASIGANGKVPRNADGAFVQADATGWVQGGATGPVPAPQTALVVSLRSEMDDLTGRGRFYHPLPAAALDATFRMSTGATQTLVTVARDFVRAVNTASLAAGAGRVVVASQGSPTRAIPPANRLVTQVSVGRVLDTVRSRRNALDEAHQALAV